MRVHIGSDHAGLELKNHLVEELTADGHEVVDHGPHAFDPDDDYPIYCIPAARGTVDDAGSLGIVIGGSGNGEQIAANKVTGVRAILAYDEETAKLGRLHNDANVISIGARMHGVDQATALVRLFLGTEFSAEARHQRRIDQLTGYEKTGELPAGN
jgi:ribose 5-phosphate isomerase B